MSAENSHRNPSDAEPPEWTNWSVRGALAGTAWLAFVALLAWWGWSR